MKVYPTEKVRNLAIVGHGGTGKTAITEAMLFVTGVTTRLGKVDEGNTVSDFSPEEIKRKISINTSLVPCEYRDHKINVLDTPGFADFIGDVYGALRVADSVVFAVSATAGVEVMTEIIWEQTEGMPKLVVINRLDKENADYYKCIDGLKSMFSENIVPVQLPIGSEANFKGVVDLLRMKALMFDQKTGKYTEESIPADLADDAELYRAQLMEAAAEGDDDLLSKFLEGEELTDDEVVVGLKGAVRQGSAVCVFCTSATQLIGISSFMDFLVECAPNPSEAAGKDLSKDPFAALIFKTIADPYVGKLSLFKVMGGTFKIDTLYNSNKEKDEKVGQLLVLRGKEQQTVTEMLAGDLGAISKLVVTSTGDTLSAKAHPITLEGISFPAALFAQAIEPKSKGDEDKLGNALSRLKEEDPTISVEKTTDTKQTVLRTMGETHADIIVDRLKTKFGVEVVIKAMKIPYRETIRSTVQVEGKHKKQSGGHGQYGHVWMRFEPLPDKDFEFGEEIFGGSVPRNYVPAVEKGIRESLSEGVLAGYPVTNLKAIIYDGSFHPVDSSEMAFKIAANLAYKKGVEMAKPVLLEPVMSVEVIVPEQFMGDIIGDFNTKRGRVAGMESAGKGRQKIKAHVPLAEMMKYAIDLKSITQGRGYYTMEFSNYDEVPGNVAEKIIEKARKEKAEEK
ncbi:MAG: elongation factor G [Methylocystaceae bacterium]